MKMKIDNVIIGAGLNGLIAHKKMKDQGIKSIIIEKGYNHNSLFSDYVIFTKKQFPFSGEKIPFVIKKIKSGKTDNFTEEYENKLYLKSSNKIDTFENKMEAYIGWSIDPSFLLSEAEIYGNIIVNSIDYTNQIIKGSILHMDEDVEIKYKWIINTIPVYKLAKYCGLNLYEGFRIFIQYYPIGIKKYKINYKGNMEIKYYSDSDIPFYRTQKYNNQMFYEYCLNKPINEKFTVKVYPGKFHQLKEEEMELLASIFINLNILNIGRFARWNPDWLLDNTYDFNYKEIIG